MKRQSLLSLLLGAVFSSIGLYLAFRNVPMASLWDYLAQIHYLWMLPAAIALAMAYLVRTIRWQWLLKPAGYPRFSSAYHSVVISMMINCLLPGRVGELARPIVLKKIEGLPYVTTLASLGVERLLDLFALLLLFVPTVITFLPAEAAGLDFGSHHLSRGLLVDLAFLSLASAVLMLLVLLVIGSDRMRRPLIAWLRRLMDRLAGLGPGNWGNYAKRGLLYGVDLIESAATGVKSIGHLQGVGVAMISSVVFWGFNALVFYFLAVGSPEVTLSMADSCIVMVVICFFIALPSVPGFWGLWEAAGVFALSFMGVEEDVAAGYALFSHAFSILPVIAAGFASCWLLGLKWYAFEEHQPADFIKGKG